ncbi:FAD-dependent oxidoreductase [Rhodoferax sp.]|uniref:NAD(P)/FAD-dependent oxidoreductase n=1 Tax=Rhodoferax sp. TaxID=50421 RepID=UPI0025EDD630|nr:FAD-dependent oxidoreductase [Rhodoferax sp.]
MQTPDSTSSPAMVIVGAGHCGGRAALALRTAGWQAAIHLVGDEPHHPYERPPLSKDLLTGDKTAEACALLSDADLLEARITRHVARVTSIDATARHLTLSDGQTLPYQSLLLATGGKVRTLRIPGGDLPEVMTLRNLGDAAALAQRLTPSQRLLVVGGGFIGLEVAASARKLGCEVTVVEGAPRLMGRAVPEPVTERALALHRERGVRVLLGVSPQSITRTATGVRMDLADGSSIEADTILAGIGIEPDLALPQAAGLAVGRGVLVNAHLQSSVPGIFAAGDVAEFPSVLSGQLVRQETWHNAETQAAIAAQNMLEGELAAYTSLPWFWSDQYDHQLQVMGEPALAASSTTRTLDDAGGMVIFYLDANNRLVGACGWGQTSRVAKELKLARTLVERRITASADVLANPATKLKSLLSNAA